MARKARLPIALCGMVVLLEACGGGGEDDDDASEGLDLPEVDCESVVVPTYREVTLWEKCTTCHASTLSEPDRFGAPEGIDFDSYAAAKVNAELAAHTVYTGTMPLGGTATEGEKQALYAWALCGTPE